MTHCAYCGKKTNRPKFCCDRHKDKYHNEQNPRGIYKHLSRESDDDFYFRTTSPFDEDALGQE